MRKAKKVASKPKKPIQPELLAALGVIVAVTVSWTALDDITTGRQSGFVGGYLALVASLVILGGIFVLLRTRKH